MKRTAVILWAVLALVAPGMRAVADLDAYLKKPEPAYRWEKQGETKTEGGTIYDLHLVSQEWQSIVWEHRLQLFYPDRPDHPRFCGLMNTGGGGGEREAALGMTLARLSGTPFAIVYHIPKQPLYNGLTEDALVVYTWQKYMETGDESWPLHFPMAKAVLKAMDALQAFCKEAKLPVFEGFMVTGASKRGWTTWLAGASRDPRIKAIAPMVIDTLNLPDQIPHQIESFGGASEQIEDYTKTGMLEALNTPAGKRLLALEDPYSYRDRLTLPKLIINGTNDRYWAQDALNLYWNGLKGPKWVLYVPNSGHGLEDRTRLHMTLAAFLRAIAGGKRFPGMGWEYAESNGAVDLRLTGDPAPVSAVLFRARSATKDFRDSHWGAEAMMPVKGGFTGRIAPASEGYTAVFGEATYVVDGRPFVLSTQIRILEPKR